MFVCRFAKLYHARVVDTLPLFNSRYYPNVLTLFCPLSTVQYLAMSDPVFYQYVPPPPPLPPSSSSSSSSSRSSHSLQKAESTFVWIDEDGGHSQEENAPLVPERKSLNRNP
jgi:hypothetical protein